MQAGDGPADVVRSSKGKRASGLPRPRGSNANAAAPQAPSPTQPAAKGNRAKKRRSKAGKDGKGGGGNDRKGNGKHPTSEKKAAASGATDGGTRAGKARAGPRSDTSGRRGDGPGKDHREKSSRSQQPSSDRKKKSVETRFWVEFDQPGNAFLRDCLGGAGADSSAKSEWEYGDIAKAIGRAKYSDIQALYNGVAGEVMNDKTYVDVADMLGIPTRAFIIPTLLKGFDTLLASGNLDAWTPAPGADPAATQAHFPVDRMVTLGARADFRRAATPPIVDPNMSDAPGAKPNSKTWKELQTEAGNKKQKSKSCSIM